MFQPPVTRTESQIILPITHISNIIELNSNWNAEMQKWSWCDMTLQKCLTSVCILSLIYNNLHLHAKQLFFTVSTLAYFLHVHSLYCSDLQQKITVYLGVYMWQVNTYKNCMTADLMERAPNENNSTDPLALRQLQNRLQEMWRVNY